MMNEIMPVLSDEEIKRIGDSHFPTTKVGIFIVRMGKDMAQAQRDADRKWMMGILGKPEFINYHYVQFDPISWDVYQALKEA